MSEHGAEAVLSRHWELGSEGSAPLAEKVAALADAGVANFAPIYPDEMPLADKIQTIAKRIYRADEALMDQKIRDQLQALGRAGLRSSAGLHGEDAVFLHDRPEPARRADRSFGAGA